jgi:hypothetical protein
MRAKVEERLHLPAAGPHSADAVSLGEMLALAGEIYLVLLAVLVLCAAIVPAIDVPAGSVLIRIDDPAIAANVTA